MFMDLVVDLRIKTIDVELPLLQIESGVKTTKHNSSTG